MSHDFSGLKKLEAVLEELGSKSVVVGVPSARNTVREDGINQATLAAVMEFGSDGQNIPERPFLRRSMDENQSRYRMQLATELLGVLLDKQDVDTALAEVGKTAASDVRKTIESGDFTPLKEATIRRKGSSAPLIDTGALKASITYEVRDDE